MSMFAALLKLTCTCVFICELARAFAPGLPPARKCGLRCSADTESSVPKDPAAKALAQASQLRQEIADLEQELNKGKEATAATDGNEQDTSGSPPPMTSFDDSPSSPFSLAPTRWLIKMDIGREKGTWMPQSWGISGRRVEVDLCVQFLSGGGMLVESDSPFVDISIMPGRWSVGPAEGSNRQRTGSLNMISDTCRFWIETDGFARGDVTIPAGKLFFAVPAWGGKLSRKGLLTVRQKRWFVREESRILGVFGTERLNVDADGRVQPRAPRPRMPPFATGFKDG